MDGIGPRGVPRPDMHHRGKSHEELKAMTDAGEPAASQEIADQWRSMGQGLEEAGDLLARAVSGSESGWTGMAADAMRYRLGQVAEWSTSTGQGFTAASSAVGEQSGAVGEAKNRMPEPVPYDPAQIINEAKGGGLLGIMALPQKLYAQQQKHNAAYNEAVAVVAARDMELTTRAMRIPEFTTPPALNDDGGDPPPVPDDERGGGPRRRDGGAIERLGSPDGGSSSAGGPDPTGFGHAQTGSGQIGSGQTGFGQAGFGQAGPGQQPPGLTAPGSDTSGPPGGRPFAPVGGTGPGPGSPGGPGGGPGGGFPPSGFPPGGGGFGPGRGFGPDGGQGGAGGGPRGSGAGSGGGPGRGMGGATGIGPGGAAAEAAGGGRGAAAGARGGAGMGGVPMGAGRGQGDEDTEHQRPSYLEEPDPESIFGTDELTVPPVLGLD